MKIDGYQTVYIYLSMVLNSALVQFNLSVVKQTSLEKDSEHPDNLPGRTCAPCRKAAGFNSDLWPFAACRHHFSLLSLFQLSGLNRGSKSPKKGEKKDITFCEIIIMLSFS